MKPFQLSAPASAELTEAVRWYEQRRPGLGAELFDAIVQTINLIRGYPEIGAQCSGRFRSRHMRVHSFPYRVVYRVRDRDIYVVAIAHNSRRPNYWKHRS